MVTSFYRLSAVSPKVIWLISFCLTLFVLSPLVFAMSNPQALPAPGGNASAALALATTLQPEEVVIH